MRGEKRLSSRVVRFGTFEADLSAGELRRKGLKVKLQDHPFRVLALLLERPGEVVTREELRERLWSADTFVEFDHSVNTAIRKIREALDDSATNPQFIETLPKRGYRFVGSVEDSGPTSERAGESGPTAPAYQLQRRWKIGGSSLIVGAVVAAVWFASAVSERDHEETAWRMIPLTSFVGAEFSTSWSPDGNFISMSRWYEGSYDVFVMPRTGGQPRRITDSPADDFCPRWSPDGRWLAYLSNEGVDENVYLVSPSGGRGKKLAETNIPYMERFDVSHKALGNNPWSPDSQELLFSRLQPNGRIALWSIGVNTGQETQVTAPPPGHNDLQGAWSSDGKSIVFLRCHTGKCGLWLLTGPESEPQPLLADDFNHLRPVWSPDDRRVVFESNKAGAMNLWEITVSSRQERQLTKGPGREGWPIISRQGELAYTHHRHQIDLYLRDLASGDERQLTRDTRRTYQPRLSPDGKMVAYQSNRTGNFDIWVLDLSTGEQKQITAHPADDHAPDWSPDSSQIVFFSDREAGMKLWVTDAAGGPERPLTDLVAPNRERGSGVVAGPKWSPDGRVIGCVAPSEKGSALWIVDLETLAAKPVLVGVADFGWYKDSRHVIVTPAEVEEKASRLIKVINLETKQQRKLFDGPHAELAVASDGSGVTFVSGPSHNRKSLWLLRLKEPSDGEGLPSPVGTPEPLTHGNDWHAHNGGWSWNGKSIVYMRDTLQADIYLLENYR